MQEEDWEHRGEGKLKPRTEGPEEAGIQVYEEVAWLAAAGVPQQPKRK